MRARWKRFLAAFLAATLLVSPVSEVFATGAGGTPIEESVNLTGETAGSETGETPKEETGETLGSETGMVPGGETGETSKDETGETSKDETGETPKEETGETPKEETGETPKDETGETPEDETGETPKETEDTQSAEERLEGVPTVASLSLLEADEVGAGMDMEPRMLQAAPGAEGSTWYFDAYYVNEDSRYDSRKTDDFHLKYQMEFHTSQILEKNTVKIRIPQTLLTDREGKAVNPTQIAVPEGTPGSPVPSKNSPFNYYVDGADLVFFNYEQIKDGSNAAFQVLYKNVEAMKVKDMTSWSFTPEITVTVAEGKDESQSTTPLTGVVDTTALLTSLTKEPYVVQGKSYGPSLYTPSQVETFIGGKLPEQYASNFKDYRYVLWEVRAKGEGNQPFYLSVTDTPGTNETIVGVRQEYLQVGIPQPTLVFPEGGLIGGQEAKITEDYRERNWVIDFYVVTANPIGESKEFENTLSLTLTPVDGEDEPRTRTDDAKYTYVDYQWKYCGDTIGVKKFGKYSYPSWLDIYKYAKEEEKDAGDFSFATRGWCYGYGYTHQTASSADLGEYKKGSYYRVTMVDDAVYAYSSEAEPKAEDRLTGEDYYFSRVEVSRRDVGYDPWEDKEAAPEFPEGIDYDVSIYAMYAENPDGTSCYPKGDEDNGWELVEKASWETDKAFTYSFTPEQLARKPWRVKVEYNSINYLTICDIEVDVRLRQDSPKLDQILKETPNLKELTLENISGIAGKRHSSSEDPGNFFHQQVVGDKENYKEPGLEAFTRKLYGEMALLQRENAFSSLTALEKQAEAYKTVKESNDAVNGRGILDYCLTACDGYLVETEKDAEYLSQKGIPSPGRKEVVFYDLLPYGVYFDPSVPVTAGRITSFSEKWKTEPKSWASSQVKVRVDSATDVVENYRGTGRTRVAFHITYEGSDPSVLIRVRNEKQEENVRWMEGWGLSFRAYYDWKDAGIVRKIPNIAAFMPEVGDDRPLLGRDDEVFPDNGTLPETLGNAYKDFGADINGDGKENPDVRNVLYAKALAGDDLAVASQSNIEKRVRADADVFGSYGKETEVAPGKGYTYDITVKNSTAEEMKHIVIFDRLENAAADRGNIGNEEFTFEENYWFGTYQSLTTKALEEMEIKPVVYYNEKREARIPAGTEKPTDVLTETNGWISADKWTEGKEVRAVALDLSKKTDDSDFVLGKMESVTFQIRMKAPAQADPGVTYAYNNPSFYSDTINFNETTSATVAGNSVRVSLKAEETLEIEKQFKETPPDSVKDTEFLFTVYRNRDNGKKQKFSNQEYELFRKQADGSFIKAEGLFATDADGQLELKAGEKAVFQVIDAASLSVEEEESPFWEIERKEADADGKPGKRIIFTNKYRPVLYVQKKLTALPERLTPEEKEALESQKFTFQLLTGEGATPLANAEFWYVDSVRLDGGIPQKVTSSGNNGVGMTDKNGCFEISARDIIALFPGDSGVKYTLKEALADGSDWYCENPEKTGTLPLKGAYEFILNYYRWKDLYLTKNLTHQDPAECTREFTFQITDETGKKVTGNEWVLLNADGTETATKGNLDSEGTFTCNCAGKVVRIEKLESKKTYTIKETVSGDLYEMVNGGTVEVTMPLYSSSASAELTNDYKKRPLQVSKQVIYDVGDPSEAEKVAQAEFTMTVTVNGKPLSNFEYTLTENGKPVDGTTGSLTTDENGSFKIKHNQTAFFKDAGLKGQTFQVKETEDPNYPQIYPQGQDPWTGIFSGDGAECLFINGTSGGLLLGKEYRGASDKEAPYIDQIKKDSAWRSKLAVSLTLKTAGQDGQLSVWPKEDTPVTVVDQLDGAVKNVTWKAESPLKLEPWKIVSLTKEQLGEALSYTLEEDAADRHRMLKWVDGTWLEVSQANGDANGTLSGTLAEKPMAVLVNELEEIIPTGSRIEKRMKFGSSPVPEGAVLVWRVERFDGAGWSPAADIPYLTYDGQEVSCTQVCRTGRDGEIRLSRGTGSYPAVRFLTDNVKLNLYEGAQKGDLRMVELLEKSDETWGVLAGYGTESDLISCSWDIKPDAAVAFVNSNFEVPVEIEKKMTGSSEEQFTMYLRRVVSASASPVTKPEQILEDAPGRGIAYVLYDSASGKSVGEGLTGENGEILLKAGQYARLNLPEGTLWTVSEERKPSYVLKDLTGNPSQKTTKLADNLMLINQEQPVTVEGISLNSDMVRSGVVNALTGEHTVLNTGDVTIPQYIIWEGKVREITEIFWAAFQQTNITGVVIPESVTAIAPHAFSFCYDLTGEIEIPKGVTRIEEGTFKQCEKLTGIKLPDGVTSIGRGAFEDCRSLTGDLILPKNLTSIGENAFYQCWSLTGELSIPQGVKSIGNSAFYRCFGLTGDLTIPSGVTGIGDSAFSGCKKLTSITIPDSVTSIGTYAFRNCDNLKALNVAGSQDKYPNWAQWDVDESKINWNYTGQTP